MTSIEADAHAVLLPAFADLELDKHVTRFLRSGGKSILLGESREEYVSRAMSVERRALETADKFRAVTARATELTGPVIVAVDQELAGIQRLTVLGAELPSLDEAKAMSDRALALRCGAVATVARSVGVNLFLAPIVDVVTGGNAWLSGRTLGPDAAVVSRLGAAFVRGVQDAGVAATAKHFPGYPALDADPAIEDTAYAGELSEASLAPFRAAIAAGVRAVMTGPAPVVALGGGTPASISPAVMTCLREGLGFKGLIITDDLDSKATLRGGELDAVAIEALDAGGELLLLAAGPHVEEVAHAIADAVRRGRLEASKLTRAAAKVRALAHDLHAGTRRI